MNIGFGGRVGTATIPAGTGSIRTVSSPMILVNTLDATEVPSCSARLLAAGCGVETAGFIDLVGAATISLIHQQSVFEHPGNASAARTMCALHRAHASCRVTPTSPNWLRKEKPPHEEDRHHHL